MKKFYLLFFLAFSIILVTKGFADWEPFHINSNYTYSLKDNKERVVNILFDSVTQKGKYTILYSSKFIEDRKFSCIDSLEHSIRAKNLYQSRLVPDSICFDDKYIYFQLPNSSKNYLYFPYNGNIGDSVITQKSDYLNYLFKIENKEYSLSSDSVITIGVYEVGSNNSYSKKVTTLKISKMLGFLQYSTFNTYYISELELEGIKSTENQIGFVATNEDISRMANNIIKALGSYHTGDMLSWYIDDYNIENSGYYLDSITNVIYEGNKKIFFFNRTKYFNNYKVYSNGQYIIDSTELYAQFTKPINSFNLNIPYIFLTQDEEEWGRPVHYLDCYYKTENNVLKDSLSIKYYGTFVNSNCMPTSPTDVDYSCEFNGTTGFAEYKYGNGNIILLGIKLSDGTIIGNYNIVSVQENYITSRFLSPNPVFDKLNLYNLPANAMSYEIYDQLGIKVSGGIIANEIDVSTLPAGIYFLKIGNEKPRKFIKV